MATTIDEAEQADLAAFRRKCQEFLSRHARHDLPAERDDPRGNETLAMARAFQQRVAAAGLAGLCIQPPWGPGAHQGS